MSTPPTTVAQAPRATRRRSGGPRARGRLARLGAALVVVLALAACTAIPRSGPVQAGDGTFTDDGNQVDVLAEGPRPGATPQQIVEGFQLAGAAGFAGDFATAREYLLGTVQHAWEPLAEVVVYDPPMVTATTEDGVVTASVQITAHVDAAGRFVEAPRGATTSATYTLEKNVAGEWRLTGVPDGLVIPDDAFDRQFRSVSLYFPSFDGAFLVPETRWFPTQHLPTWVTRALLAGPSPWLRDAVTTAVPEGVSLQADTVVVDDSGVAQVALQPARTVLQSDTAALYAQIDATLAQVVGVGDVRVTAGDVPIVEETSYERGGPPDAQVEMVRGTELVTLGEDGLSAVPGVGEIPEGAHGLARSEDGTVRVMLDAAGALVTVPRDDAESQVLLPAAGLAAPSVDRLGWVWTARTSDGVVAVRAGQDPVVVPAEWLVGRKVVSLRMSRDATRLAIVSRGADGVAVTVSSVVRDAQGTPQQLGEPVVVGALLTDASEVVWLDEGTLGVLGTSGDTPLVHRVPVSGFTTTEADLPDVTGLAGGRVVLVTTQDGTLHRLVGSTWALVPGVHDVRDPSYPG